MTKEYKYTGTWAELIGMVKWCLTTVQASKDDRSDFLEICRNPSVLQKTADEYGITDHMIMKLIVQCAEDINKDTGFNLRAMDENAGQLALLALSQVVAKQYDGRLYSIGKYQESAICIESAPNGYAVYWGERGNHYDEVIFSNASGACMEFMNRLTHDEVKRDEMKKEFRALLDEYLA
jgi:hypothetical protein